MSNYLLTNDEKIVLNELFAGEEIAFYSRDKCLDDIEFVILNHSDEDILDLYKGLKEKISNITPEEWEINKVNIPYRLIIRELEIL